MTFIQAVLMGLIQGLTEFLPVSSSGHLAIFKTFFNLQETGLIFDVLLHIGTLIAVFAVYYKDIIRMIIEGLGIVFDVIYNIYALLKKVFLNRKIHYRRIIKSSYRKFVMLIIVSTIPTGIIGVLCSDYIDAASGILIIPGICLIITGILLLISDYTPSGTKMPKNVTYSTAFIIGTAQGIATLPGLSRSGTTITACLLSGLDKRFAVKYSFIMSMPAILGAAVFELKGNISSLSISFEEIINYVAGMAVSAVVGYICIKTMLKVVRGRKFKYFAIYCFFIGAISIGAYFLI